MTKLRAWEMEEYSKVLILDGDILLAKPLDGVFTDPGAQLMETKPKGHKDDEPELPKDYLLSAIIDYNPNVPHNWPPTDAGRRRGHFNAGFFMLRPDKKLFNYFVGLLDVVDRFNPKFPEQNMLNYAFRWDGPMPFKEVSAVWNTNFANEDDLKAGTASVHMKFWKVDDKPMLKFAMSKRWQMEGYYLGRGDA
jgi:alpha-N-acetylglucosamine transferase